MHLARKKIWLIKTTLIFIFQMLLVQIRRHVTKLFGDQSNAAVILGGNFSAGFIAGVISAGATCPLDVAKTRREIEASAGFWASALYSKFSFSWTFFYYLFVLSLHSE